MRPLRILSPMLLGALIIFACFYGCMRMVQQSGLPIYGH